MTHPLFRKERTSTGFPNPDPDSIADQDEAFASIA